MTIPKKGSRRLEVGGTTYAWRIRKSPTYAQGAFATSMTVAIEATAETRGTVLVVDLMISRPDNWLRPHKTAVTPSLVRHLILRGLDAGWRPSVPGAAMRLEHPLEETGLSPSPAPE